MLSQMSGVLSGSPSNSSQEVYVAARAVAGLTKISDELSPSAQVGDGCFAVVSVDIPAK